MIEKLKALLVALKTGQLMKWILPGTAALAATAIIVSLLWQSNNHYVMLYGSQQTIPIAQVVEVLSGELISYRVEPNSGNLLVRETDLPRARMALAAKGVFSHTPAGYELMDKDAMLGSSQFIQNVRFKRSMEGELAQSIMALDAVDYARVHLGISETSSFVLNNKPDSTASVMVRVRLGQQLSDDQVTAIVNLITGSVPGMKPGQVRVVDQHGALLSANLDAAGNGTLNNKISNKVLLQVRKETERSLANVLDPVVGSGNFRISVVPRINFSEVEETQERFLGDPRTTRESLQQENTTGPLALGVPGSLNNRPANQAPPPANPPQLATRNQAQRQFNYDRDVRHIRHPGYQVEKLSVAVVLNESSPAVKAWTEQNRQQVQQMLQRAAGIDPQRGDELNLSLLAFPEVTPWSEPPIPWWERTNIIDWSVRGGIALLLLSLTLFGILPVLRRFSRRDPKPLPVKHHELPEGVFINDDPASGPQQDTLPPQGAGLETKIAYLQTLAGSETDRVAEVIKQWIKSHERNADSQ
ncbi:flagellar basal-body MS-ring/collar protein FliF [Erwinia amylovora]